MVGTAEVPHMFAHKFIRKTQVLRNYLLIYYQSSGILEI